MRTRRSQDGLLSPPGYPATNFPPSSSALPSASMLPLSSARHARAPCRAPRPGQIRQRLARDGGCGMSTEDMTHDPAAHAGPVAGGLNQFISFAIGDDQYGVDIMAVREIKGWSDITGLPKQPDYVRGVLNLRGVMVPIIDLRCRFGQGMTEATAMHIVIIVQIGSRQVRLLADRALD